MTRYRLETEDRKWVNTFNSRYEAIDYAKANLTSPLEFQGVPKNQWWKLAKRYILTNLTTREEYIVFYDGGTRLLSKYKNL